MNASISAKLDAQQAGTKANLSVNLDDLHMPEILHSFFLSSHCQFQSEHVFLMCKLQIHYFYVSPHIAYKVNLRKYISGILVGVSTNLLMYM